MRILHQKTKNYGKERHYGNLSGMWQNKRTPVSLSRMW